jgi:hypothetical protein
MLPHLNYGRAGEKVKMTINLAAIPEVKLNWHSPLKFSHFICGT